MTELPEGWEVTRIGEVVLPFDNVDPHKKPDVSFIYVDIGSIDNQSQEITAPKTLLGKDAPSRARRQIKEGDTLFSTVRTYLKNIALVPPALDNCVTSTGIAILRPSFAVDPKFLFNYARSPEFLTEVGTAMDGTMYPAVTDQDVLNQAFLLPPLPEQRRIVAKLDTLLARTRQMREELENIPSLIKQYKQAILAAAFRGELVPHNPDNESAFLMLERILEERRARWEAEQLARYVERGQTPPKNWKDKYQEPQPPNTNGLPELPEGWVWASAEQICDFITKGTTPNADEMTADTGEIPFIKVYNLTYDGSLDFTIDPTFVSRDTHEGFLARSKVVPGDVLMNIVGPPLGKVSIVPNTYSEWNINQAIVRFRPIPSISNSFLSICLMSDHILSWATTRAKATAGQFNLTLAICRELPIPIPPLNEQIEIVQRIEKAFAWLDIVLDEATSAMRLFDHLEQATLAKAFRGELVPQDPNDEPASVLLECIHEARTEQSNGSKRKKRS